MISVIVPYYRTKKEYFDKCMNSLLQEINADIEVLVIDDGSGVQYHSIIDSHLKDKRVRVFHEEHVGVSKARNVGIEQAKGEWITFVDSDDYVESNTMSVLLAAVKKTDADLIYYNGYGDKEGKVNKNHFFLEEGINYGSDMKSKSKVMESALSLGFLPLGYSHSFSLGGVCCKLIKRSILMDYNIRYDSRIHFAEDTLFSMNLIKEAKHIVYIDQYLYHYNINSDSVTNKYRVGLKDDMKDFFEAAWDFIKSNNLETYLSEAYYIRAYIELQRCIRKEIWHKENKKNVLKKYRDARIFLNKDPFNTALCMKSEYIKGIRYLMISFLLKSGLFQTYIFLYDRLKKLKDSLIWINSRKKVG